MSPETSPQSDRPSRQFGIGAVLKLIVLLSIPLAIANATGDRYFSSILGGAILGLFLAEYFGTNARLEGFFLLGSPLLAASLSAVFPIAREYASATASDILIQAFLGALVGIIPSVVMIILVNGFSACFFVVTGIRLIKYEWNPQD